MAQLDESTKYAIAILKALNKAVDEGPWDYNLFYQAIGKQLKELRDKFKDELNLNIDLETGLPSVVAKRVAERSGLQEVYISLYVTEGLNLSKWEALLFNIEERAITRPIYADEEHAKMMLRAAANKQNEAYIIAYIKAEDILPPSEPPPKDKLGSPLLTIKERAITRENIARFVHITGQYEYEHGKLVRLGTVDF